MWGSYYDPFGMMMMSSSSIYRDDGSIDRSGFAEKSQAAMDREARAKQLLDNWIAECSKLDDDAFPVTNSELVVPKVHLTQPCYYDFRKYALQKGVKVGRRQATDEERKASGDKRKGKLYMIWAKLEVPPSRAVEHLAAAKAAKASAAALKKRAVAGAAKENNAAPAPAAKNSNKKAKKTTGGDTQKKAAAAAASKKQKTA